IMKNYQLRKYEILTEKFAKMGQTMVHHQSGYLGLNADAGEGRVNRVGQPEELPQGDVGDVASALAYVQKVAELHPDDFSRWAATSDILKKSAVILCGKLMSTVPAKLKIRWSTQLTPKARSLVVGKLLQR